MIRPSWNDMYRLAVRLAPAGSADDVLQEALSSAWRKRHQHDAERGSLRVWLLAIVADQARKSHRSAKPTVELLDVHPAQPQNDFNVDQVVVKAAVDTLADRQRLAVTLHYYLGFSISETAAVMDCTPGTVKSTLSDARTRLRIKLGEGYQ